MGGNNMRDKICFHRGNTNGKCHCGLRVRYKKPDYAIANSAVNTLLKRF